MSETLDGCLAEAKARYARPFTVLVTGMAEDIKGTLKEED